MNDNRQKSVVDFNQSRQTSSTAKPPLQMHNFMPMSTSTVHGNHQRDEARNSCFMNQLKQHMQSFWRERLAEICEAPSDVRGQNTLPLARIKKVMKSDDHVKMISADTPVVFAKACEMFIMELTLRAWMHTQDNKRRTLQRNDVANAIRDEALLQFLKEMVPLEINQEDQLSLENHQGVYVPVPVRASPSTPPNYSMNVQSMNQNQHEAVATRAHPVATDHHRFAFPMNLQYNPTPSFFTRHLEMQQQQDFTFPRPPPANEENPYHDFKNFLQ